MRPVVASSQYRSESTKDLPMAVRRVLVGIEQMQLMRVLILRNLNRILARKSRIAKALPYAERLLNPG
jgi:hypothetical protein